MHDIVFGEVIRNQSIDPTKIIFGSDLEDHLTRRTCRDRGKVVKQKQVPTTLQVSSHLVLANHYSWVALAVAVALDSIGTQLAVKPGLHISRKDRKHMVATKFLKLFIDALVFP